ncbi:MAG: acetyl-CoA carboxylase biotin carboxyl carrier protein [Pseudomonadota bacterium]
MSNKKSDIDTKLIRDLAKLIKDTDLNEIEVEEGDLRIRLVRGGVEYSQPAVTYAAAPAPAPAPAATPAPAANETTATSDAEASGTPVKSPMVGTAYLSPAPGADAFVKVGQTVKKGQTIMIVEAMKTMNQIPATADGVVASIAVEDGQPVEFGQNLIVLS